MYPFIRLAWQFLINRNAPILAVDATHVSQHICLPTDIDLWWELNNGRTLTLYDLGRLPLAGRVGLLDTLKKNRWGLTMAGVSVRYRKRIRMWQRFEMRSRAVGYDSKFLYLEQSLWRNGDCCGHALYRSAVTDKNGLIPPHQVMQALGRPFDKPLPEWVQAWIDADAHRPWPPMQDIPA
ncbi:MAG: acyl-CoA thioesterase [Pseudomonadota bacterium]